MDLAIEPRDIKIEKTQDKKEKPEKNHTSFRAFFGVSIDNELQKDIDQQRKRLFKAPIYESIRWIKKENLHLTLTFLGKINIQKSQQLIQSMQQIISEQKCPHPFSIEFNHLIALPSTHTPRVIALAPDPTSTHPNSFTSLNLLKQLAEITQQVAIDANIEIESRPYLPHLTIGRIRQKTLHLDKSFNQLIWKNCHISIDKIQLFQSKPTSTGVQYLILEMFSLHHKK
jgi:2'-5' RNA ligase